MKQLTQKLKTGTMQILEVPVPDLRSGMVLVRNRFSLISAGTEGGTVTAARKSLLGKAKERPEQVKQVLDTLKAQGPMQTYRAVMKKLDTWSPLGYSCVGEVIDLASDVHEFSVGDFVACGGLTASHAEVVTVPKNLCVKLPPGADLKKAAYNTLGAIAMQGVRQANLRLGETCAVIGLGLVGQLTAALLKASGTNVIGVDTNPAMVELGGKHCLDLALERDDPGIEDAIASFTKGIGCDSIIIAAASDSLDPVNFAGAIARKKGTIVVVGAVPTGFDRETFYRKELELRMSCSYGPGRYDLSYEEKGIDYPVGYVRWTEKRNMEAFQDLVHSGKIEIDYMTTHIFKLEDAPKAYDMILEKREPSLGILIEYDPQITQITRRIEIAPSAFNLQPAAVSIGFIGAGSYAQGNLLPNIPKNDPAMIRKGIMTSSGTTSRSAAERFGFEFCTSDEKDIFENKDINTVFIATRHDSHAYYVKKALEAGKHVFVEKPLCLTMQELEEIIAVYCKTNQINEIDEKDQTDQTNDIEQINQILMVGYNRRFSALSKILKEKIGSGAMAMLYRINAGGIPADSWIQDPEIGGGRIIGEVCHFIDYLTWLNGSLPLSIHAAAMDDKQGLHDTITISLTFENGSIGTVSYFANGPRTLPKEYIEVYAKGTTSVLTDFKKLEIFGDKKVFSKKLISQDKGQKEMIAQFIKATNTGSPSPIPFQEIYAGSLATFKAIDSLKTGQAAKIE
ncbi:MAG: bi-domain-containing oxidoreductase [Dissulfuribacterales bacterium]